MNLELDDVALFLRIRSLGTLSAAARERNWPVSQVSRALARLENTCGVRLLHRSTHGLSLTDEGDTFAAYAQRLMDTRDELASELTGKLVGPSGWVRLSVSPLLAEAVIAPSLCGLYERHPGLHIDIAADDRMADMAREGIDIALRTGTPHSDTLVARPIGELGRTLCAAPSYLARHGTPTHPNDLQHHRLLANSASPALNRWPLARNADGRPGGEVQVHGHTRTDNTAVTLALVLQGVGLARINDRVAGPLIRSGALVPLLQDHLDDSRVPVYAVMLQERQRLPKIRACIDWWAQWLAQGTDAPRPA
jgi:DNA-binding transcriptional LysR family regulator